MHELLILRHAEAEPAEPGGSDLDRPLTAHGAEQAQATGQWLLEHEALPDTILCSPATRARATATRAAACWGTDAADRIDYVDAIYEASPGQLLTQLDRLDPALGRVLLVGHNPGLERLLALLCEGRSAGFRGMPAAALAWLRLDGALEPGNGELRAFHTP